MHKLITLTAMFGLMLVLASPALAEHSAAHVRAGADGSACEDFPEEVGPCEEPSAAPAATPSPTANPSATASASSTASASAPAASQYSAQRPLPNTGGAPVLSVVVGAGLILSGLALGTVALRTARS